jgi:hypothetical protein
MRESRSQSKSNVVPLFEVPTSQGSSGTSTEPSVSGISQRRLCADTDSAIVLFADKLERNREITTWYHDIDNQLSAYMGTPEPPTWARFAKHASYSAGVQLRIEPVLVAKYNGGRAHVYTHTTIEGSDAFPVSLGTNGGSAVG